MSLYGLTNACTERVGRPHASSFADIASSCGSSSWDCGARHVRSDRASPTAALLWLAAPWGAAGKGEEGLACGAADMELRGPGRRLFRTDRNDTADGSCFSARSVGALVQVEVVEVADVGGCGVHAEVVDTHMGGAIRPIGILVADHEVV